MKNSFLKTKKENQKVHEGNTNFNKMKSSEILVEEQYDKIIGGSSNIVIADKDIL